MNWFSNLKLAYKLGLSFGLCIMISLAAGSVAIQKMAQMNVQGQELSVNSVASLRTLSSIQTEILFYRIREARLALTSEPTEKEKIISVLNDDRKKATDAISTYQKNATDPDDVQNIKDLNDNWKSYLSFDTQFFGFARSNNHAGASKILNGPSLEVFDNLDKNIETLNQWNDAHAKRLGDGSTQLYTAARITVIILLAIGSFIGACLAWLTSRALIGVVKQIDTRLTSLNTVCIHNLQGAINSLAQGKLDSKIVTGTSMIENPGEDEFGRLSKSINGIISKVQGTIEAFSTAQTALKEKIEHTHNSVISAVQGLDHDALVPLCEGITAVASGDLTKKIDAHVDKMTVDQNSDFAKLAAAFNEIAGRVELALNSYNTAQASLAELIDQARGSAETISNTSAQVADSSADLSDRTSEQASSLEETASSMEQMTGIVKQNASNAAHASDLANQAKQIANAGGEVVHSAVDSMSEINTASRRIADIISVIDEIAFQTNLLALNAAVEAARVGEQGKGFAVVASEVRSLAARSSTAAKEIKALVQDSVQKVQDGTELVNKSGVQLQEIVSSVNKVAEIVAEISAASQEQSAGIEQVNKAVTQMDEITQQNAASVEESAALSQTMSSQASDLKRLVSQFKTDQGAFRNTPTVNVSKEPKEQKIAVGQNQKPRSKPRLTLRSTGKSEDLEF